MENSALRRVGAVFQLYGAPLHFFRRDRAFLNGILRNRWLGRGGAIFWPPRSPYLTPGFFFLGVCEKCKMWMRCVTESFELQSALLMKCLPIPGNKLNVVWMCIVPLMVPILRSSKVHCLKMYRFLQCSLWFECMYFTLLSFKFEHYIVKTKLLLPVRKGDICTRIAKSSRIE
jgi:hypothetical protein